MLNLQDLQRDGKLFANRYKLLHNHGRRGVVEVWDVEDSCNENTTISVFDNQYIFIRLIGKGGFSEVWLAYDSVSLLEFAIKVYSQVGTLSTAGENEFRKEFAMMCELNHTNLLHPQTFNIYDSLPYLVLPYCPNGSAEDRIGKMSEPDIWKFAKDVASGLTYLHSKNPPVIHRDMKPLNILINKEGQYLISDFGISMDLRKSMSKNQNDLVGTLAYMGPECHPKKGECEVPLPVIANDIWAFGATLYEIATGKLPFGEFGGLSQRSNHVVPKINEDFSEDLKKLIYSCLEEEPWNRPSSDEIVDFITNRNTPVVRTYSKPRPWIPRIKYIVVFLLIIAFSVGLSIYKFIRQGEEDKKLREQKYEAMISKISEADSIVFAQWNSDVKFNNYAKPLSNDIKIAVDIYNDAIINAPDDKARLEGESAWNKSRQIISELNDSLSKLEQYYRSIGAEAPADSFRKRQEELKQYIQNRITKK